MRAKISLSGLRALHRESATGEWFCGPNGGTSTTWHIQGANYVCATGMSEADARAIVAEHNAALILLEMAEAMVAYFGRPDDPLYRSTEENFAALTRLATVLQRVLP